VCHCRVRGRPASADVHSVRLRDLPCRTIRAWCSEVGETADRERGELCLGHTARVPQLTLTQDAAADELLSRDPLALLLGMLFDQHVSRGTVESSIWAVR